MTRFLSFFGASVGGWVGWIAGAQISFMAAFMIGMIGTGLGMYFGRKIARDHF
ncbi:MAG TPA: hypothetical protein VFI91_14720 [Longimicrobiaceae bacterium]|nr:hypothetical protein [Longimicrobiaceae bacterium]